MADRGYVLQTGKIVLEGNSQSLLESELMKKAYLGILSISGFSLFFIGSKKSVNQSIGRLLGTFLPGFYVGLYV